MRTILAIIGTAVVVGLAGGAVGYLVRKNVAESKIATAEEQAIRIVQDAEQAGEAKRKEMMMEAKEEIHRLRSDMERENKDRRNDLQRQERRLLQKEENLDRKIESFERKEEKLALLRNCPPFCLSNPCRAARQTAGHLLPARYAIVWIIWKGVAAGRTLLNCCVTTFSLRVSDRNGQLCCRPSYTLRI